MTNLANRLTSFFGVHIESGMLSRYRVQRWTQCLPDQRSVDTIKFSVIQVSATLGEHWAIDGSLCVIHFGIRLRSELDKIRKSLR